MKKIQDEELELLDLRGETEEKPKLAVAQYVPGAQSPFGEGAGSFYFPSSNSAFGITPEKLVVPREYHSVLQMVYDFYQRGGLASTVLQRLEEFSITPIRNGQRQTTDETLAYFNTLVEQILMIFLRTMAREYYLSGMLLPRVDWVKIKGADLSPDLRPNKVYQVPQLDLYPPMLVEVRWAGWGQKEFWLKIPDSDLRLIRNGGSRIKAQQNKYISWKQNYPMFVQQVVDGSDSIKLDTYPILRKEISISPYPTPFLYPVLEPLIYKQHLRRMDFSVAARVINAILLVQEGDSDFPLVATPAGVSNNLTALQNQLQGRAGNPLLMERLFMLFTNHTTKLTWITPDVSAMLNQEKYQEVNSELQQGLGFTQVLVTGESRQAQASEVSTWAIQPQMEELRDLLIQWLITLYKKAGALNGFDPKKLPVPEFRPIKLQDIVKTAAIMAQGFKEGNMSRTTRAESLGLNLKTEVELIKDEQVLLKGLPAFQPTAFSPPPPNIGNQKGNPGRPIGSQNVPLNNRNVGVKPPGQEPLSKIGAELEELSDEELIDFLNAYAEERGIVITADMIIDKDDPKE